MGPTKLVVAAAVLSVVAAAQSPITADSPFQVRYASNLTTGDSVINITNTAANGDNLFGPGTGGSDGNICVNVYAFSPDEQLISCCSCLVTPSGLVSLSVASDLISNTLTGVRPDSVVIKLISTLAGTGGSDVNCTNSAGLARGAVLAAGLAAWGTTIRPGVGGLITMTETPFTPATLSDGELASITNRCAFTIGNASPFGICRSCRSGGLGAAKGR